MRDEGLKDLPLHELQDKFNQYDASVRAAEPQVQSMEQAAQEARMILEDLKFRRGHVAYWLTIRKGQR